MLTSGISSKFLVSACVLAAVCIGSASAVRADITADGSLGTTVNLNGGDYAITGGSQIGGNLFHSFDIFDVGNGQSATFLGPLSTENIIGRITGGTPSFIDGILRSDIPGANLFLINPAGMMFGPGASLQVDGSFHVSTADYLGFGDGAKLYVDPASGSSLSATAPNTFGFLGNEPAPITFDNSIIDLPDGETISVIAGDISLADATLFAPAGRINIASVASKGEVTPLTDGIDLNGFDTLGDVAIVNAKRGRPLVESRSAGNLHVSGTNGGRIFLRAGNLRLDHGVVFADTDGPGAPGLIDFNVTHDVLLENESIVTTDTLKGLGGTVHIRANNIAIANGTRVAADTFGSGNAGSVILEAGNAIVVGGVSSPEDSRLRGGLVSTVGSSSRSNLGDGGTVELRAQTIEITDLGIVEVVTLRAGDAGTLTIDTHDLLIQGGGQLRSTTEGSGNGGTININLSGSLTVMGSGVDIVGGVPKEIRSAISSVAFSSGSGGTLTISGGHVVVADGGVLFANLEDAPRPGQPSPRSETRAGTIIIDAKSISVLNGGQILTLNRSAGAGGAIFLTADETITIAGDPDGDDLTGVVSGTENDGSGGNIVLDSENVTVMESATVNASTLGNGNAGAIRIFAADSVHIEGGSLISTRAEGAGTGQGGIIEIAAATIQISGGGNVNAASTNQSDAGTISLTGRQSIYILSNGVVSSSSINGGGGQISLAAGDMIYVRDSKITSSVTLDDGDGGNISVGLIQDVGTDETRPDTSLIPKFFIVQGSDILAQANQGSGGDITIFANAYIKSPDARVDASSKIANKSGTIKISSPEVDLSGALLVLSRDYNEGDRLLHEPCAARELTERSSLSLRGHGGVAPGPNTYQGVPVARSDAEVTHMHTRRAGQFQSKPEMEQAYGPGSCADSRKM